MAEQSLQQKKTFVEFEKSIYWLHLLPFFVLALVFSLLPSSLLMMQFFQALAEVTRNWWPKMESDSSAIARWTSEAFATRYVLNNLFCLLVFPFWMIYIIRRALKEARFAWSPHHALGTWDRYMQPPWPAFWMALILMLVGYVTFFEYGMAQSDTRAARFVFRTFFSIPWSSLLFSCLTVMLLRLVGILKTRTVLRT